MVLYAIGWYESGYSVALRVQRKNIYEPGFHDAILRV